MRVDLHKVVFGSLIYMFWTVIIGYLFIQLASWAIIISALIAGIYSGFKTRTKRGTWNGFAAGLAGGIILGVASLYTPTIYGIPLSTSVTEFLNPFSNIASLMPWISIPTLAVIGCIFGSIGGLFGSITQLRKIFLFLVLFTMFMFYLALDNVAWYLGRTSWEWSLTHVLTHWVDITVSLAFALFVVVLADVLKIYQ